MVGSTWKAKINPKEFMFSTKSPNKNRDPSLVNPRVVTKIELSHSNPFCTNGTFKISIAKMICISNPFQTNCQLIFFRSREKEKAINSKVIIPKNPLDKFLNENPELVKGETSVSFLNEKLMPFSFRISLFSKIVTL